MCAVASPRRYFSVNSPCNSIWTEELPTRIATLPGSAFRIYVALFRVIAQRNPEAMRKAAQPALEAAEKWERVLSVQPGSDLALELERLNGKSLAELKAQAEKLSPFLRSAANIPLSLLK
jgi:hypothetical protein